jgi:hypothetical protein
MMKNTMAAIMPRHAIPPTRPPAMAPALEECVDEFEFGMGIGAPDIGDVVEVGFGVIEGVLGVLGMLGDAGLRVVVKLDVEVAVSVAVTAVETIARLVTSVASVVVAGVPPASVYPFIAQ